MIAWAQTLFVLFSLLYVQTLDERKLSYEPFPPAVKNQVSGNFILNPKGKGIKNNAFIEMGLEWEYAIENGKESLKTSGPLHEAISVLVSPGDV